MADCLICVYFEITGDEINPELITSALQVKPTAIWRNGDKMKGHNGKKIPCYKFSRWSFSTGSVESLDVDKQLNVVYEKFKNKVGIINNLVKKHDLNISIDIVIENAEERPSIVIEQKIIKFCYFLDASIDIDLN